MEDSSNYLYAYVSLIRVPNRIIDLPVRILSRLVKIIFIKHLPEKHFKEVINEPPMRREKEDERKRIRFISEIIEPCRTS